MGSYEMSGGGPWSGGPWGGPPRHGNGGNPPPRGRGPQPPDFEDLVRRGQDQLRRVLPGGVGGSSGMWIPILIVAALVFWLVNSLYTVQPDEQGVVLRFGQYDRTEQPGWHLVPYPYETMLRPRVTHVNQLEIGFRSTGAVASGTQARGTGREIDEESHMLTGDENIVDINFTVQWLIKDARDYLFSIRNPDDTVRAAAESAMREVVGRTPIAAALAEGKAQIMSETRDLLQKILDSYGAGITVTEVFLQKVDPPAEVIDAFNDVQRARADQERKRNEAETYRNGILPVARGQAVQLVQDAEAYKQKVVAEAQGEAQRFLSVYNAYVTSKEVTTRRLYIETMQEILRNANKTIIDKAAGSGVVPYLALPQIGAGSAPASAPPADAATAGAKP